MSITRAHFAARFNLSRPYFFFPQRHLPPHIPVSKQLSLFLSHTHTHMSLCYFIAYLSAMLLVLFSALFIFLTSIFSLSFFATLVSSRESLRLCLLHCRGVPITFVLSIYYPLYHFNLQVPKESVNDNGIQRKRNPIPAFFIWFLQNLYSLALFWVEIRAPAVKLFFFKL